ncbi:MAG: HAMP domain-containing histidine kinase [Eubacterium sp.]|nr:HAMP domain-containing histidine kinase [Eubacterium sp.]
MGIALGICIVIICILLLKIYMMKKSVREIRTDFGDRGKLDSNSLIGVSSRDKDIRALTNDMNHVIVDLRKAFHKYKEGDREVRTAITNISHDIRTPLTAICGYLALMKKQDKSPEMERYLDIIDERAEHMKALTEGLFSYSLILNSEEQVELEDVSLNKVLEDCIMEYYGALSERGIEPTIDITENKIVRKLDKTHIDRAISNVISNAIKYSDGDFDIKLKDDGTMIFSNKASGITSVEAARLFDRFYTVETGRNSTGLGLSIARTFVEQMGGEIGAEYKNGRLAIRISFPER